MYIVGGTASKSTAEDLAKNLKMPLANTTAHRFPDNEFYFRILDDIKGEDVVIIQTTYPDNNIIELLLMQEAIKDAQAQSITVIMPYFGYSRQDQRFQKGEPISAKVLAEHISMKADKIFSIDPHKEYIMDFFTVPSASCTALFEIATYLQKTKKIDLVLAPDKGAMARAKQASEIIQCEYDYLEKTRIDGKTVNIKPKNLDAKAKNAVIIDDIISTGGTMAKAIAQLKNQGANKIYAACTHGVFAGEAKQKLQSSGCDEILCTDTIHNEFSKIKTAPALAEALSKKEIF